MVLLDTVYMFEVRSSGVRIEMFIYNELSVRRHAREDILLRMCNSYFCANAEISVYILITSLCSLCILVQVFVVLV